MPPKKKHINVVYSDMENVPKTFAKIGKGRYQAYDYLAERNQLAMTWKTFYAEHRASASQPPFPPLAPFLAGPAPQGAPLDFGKAAYGIFLEALYSDIALAARHHEDERLVHSAAKDLHRLWMWNPKLTLAALSVMSSALDKISAKQRAIEFLRTHRRIKLPPSAPKAGLVQGSVRREILIENATAVQLSKAMREAGIPMSPQTAKKARQEMGRMDEGQVFKDVRVKS